MRIRQCGVSAGTEGRVSVLIHGKGAPEDAPFCMGFSGDAFPPVFPALHPAIGQVHRKYLPGFGLLRAVDRSAGDEKRLHIRAAKAAGRALGCGDLHPGQQTAVPRIVPSHNFATPVADPEHSLFVHGHAVGHHVPLDGGDHPMVVQGQCVLVQSVAVHAVPGRVDKVERVARKTQTVGNFQPVQHFDAAAVAGQQVELAPLFALHQIGGAAPETALRVAFAVVGTGHGVVVRLRQLLDPPSVLAAQVNARRQPQNVAALTAQGKTAHVLVDLRAGALSVRQPIGVHRAALDVHKVQNAGFRVPDRPLRKMKPLVDQNFRLVGLHAFFLRTAEKFQRSFFQFTCPNRPCQAEERLYRMFSQ